MASWLVHSTPDRAVRVRDLAGDIALCSWARPLILTVPLSTQVYKWVPANLMLGVTQGGVEIFLVASCGQVSYTAHMQTFTCNGSSYSSLGFSSFGVWLDVLLAPESLPEDKLEDEDFFGD